MAILDDAVERDLRIGELGEEGLAGVGEEKELSIALALRGKLLFLIEEAEEEQREDEARDEYRGGEPEGLAPGNIHEIFRL